MTLGATPQEATGLTTAEWAAELGVSTYAIELYQASDVIDLHVDSFIWTRILGYDLTRPHGRGIFGARFYSQVDLPRLRNAGVTGASFVITTNPWRTSRGREAAFFRNIERLSAILGGVPEEARLVRTAAEYRQARHEGLHGAFIAVQGGNALDHNLDAWARIPEGVVSRVTLVHLTSSRLGATSSPLRIGDSGLTPLGAELVERLDNLRIFVDLAHISRKGFFDVVRAHDRSLPLIVTHTGVSGVHSHWRNLDDDQLRAVADSGGTVGIMYHSEFLDGSLWGGQADSIAAHVAHAVSVIGDDHVSLGSDWDGAIVTPRDLSTCSELPRLVQLLLDRGLPPRSIQKILGGSFLRALSLLRG